MADLLSFSDLTLSSPAAVLLIFVAVAAGHFYRKAWINEGPRWQLWCYGLLAGGSLLMLGLIPLDVM
ncbi:MAG: hypothetical protein ACR2QG_06180 [Gammaproteobacteria bacterium]